MTHSESTIVTPVILASAVKRTADIYERSWKTSNGDGRGYYATDLNAAAAEVCKELTLHESYTRPIHWLLRYAWNDILDWSDEVLQIKHE